METEKFKLIDSGNNGIEVFGKEYRPSPKNPRIICVDNVSRKRRMPLNPEVTEQLKRLRYFFLNLTGHWVPPYNKHFDVNGLVPEQIEDGVQPSNTLLLLRSILNRTRVTGITLTENGFVMTGAIEVITGKVIGLATPLVTEDDDVGFYGSAVNEINRTFDLVDKFVDAPELTVAEARKMLADAGVKAEELEVQDEESIISDAIELLVSKSFIILSEEDTSHMVGNGKEKKEEKKEDKKKDLSDGYKSVNTSTGSIDGKNLPDGESGAKTSEEDDIDMDQVDKAYGLSAENQATESGEKDLSQYEYGDNMPQTENEV